MPEKQNTEYKLSWQEDHLKCICGFANAQGGTIFIGKDDKGKIIGIKDYKKLMEDIPNKVRDLMGVIVDVNLLDERGLYFLEILTQPYAVPISLRGRYYFRTGSTNQELIGTTLTEFLLRKSGKTWDEVLEPPATLKNIDNNSVLVFSNSALNAGRIENLDDLTVPELLENLNLTDERGKLKRAALILFGRNPGSFYKNCKIKIGRFGKDDTDLLFQEEEEGNIIQLLKKVPSVLNHKFFIKPINFEGLQRIEKGEYPVAAIREALLNALVHRNYLGTIIQIKVYNNHFSIWNEGLLPSGLNIEALKRTHPSRPHNPLLADVCFKGGFIEAWGTGTLKIINSCKEAGLPEPIIKEQDGGILVTLFKAKVIPALVIDSPPYSLVKSGISMREELLDINTRLDRLINSSSVKVRDRVGDIAGDIVRDTERDIVRDMVLDAHNDVDGEMEGILLFCTTQRTRKEILKKIKLVSNVKNYTAHVLPLIQLGWVQMTFPDKPSSPKQKYRTTLKGRIVTELMNYIDEEGY